MKTVVVKLTNGTGGVFAQAVTARHATSSSYTYQFINLNREDGTVTYNGTEDTIADSYNAANYGLCGLSTSQFFPAATIDPDATILVWSNAAGEPVLTLDDIQDYDFSSHYAGSSSTDGYRGGETVGCNKHLIFSETDGSLEAMTVEFQYLNSPYVKCVVGRFTNGVDGVYGAAIYAKYIDTSKVSGGIGYRFANADGSYPTTGSSQIAEEFNLGGYGIYELKATPPLDCTTLVLDTSKTWTELTDGVDLGTRDLPIRIRVTGENPTLTFDTAINRSSIHLVNESQAATATFAITPTAAASFTLDSLQLDTELALTLPLEAAPATATVTYGARLCWIAPATGGTLTTGIDGAGGVTLVSGTATFNQINRYQGGTIVQNGAVLKPGIASQVDADTGFLVGPCGAMAMQNPVTIEEGGLYDLSGRGDVFQCFAIGGTNRLVNTGGNLANNTAQTYGISLLEDATLNMTNGAFGIVTRGYSVAGTIALNGHKLVKDGDKDFHLFTSGTIVSGNGTLEIAGGLLNVAKGPLNGNGSTLRIGENGAVKTTRDLTFSRIENSGTITFTPDEATNYVKATYGGTLGTVYKTGANYGTMPFYGNSRTTYYVQSGTLGIQSSARLNSSAYAFNTTENPTANQRVVVSPGATFDVRGVIDCNCSVVIAGTGAARSGGAFVNSVKSISNGTAQTVQLSLTADATVGGAYDFGLLAPGHNETRLDLGEHTLTIDKGGCFWMDHTTVIGEGTVRLTRGILCIWKAASGQDWSLEIGENGTITNSIALTLANFQNEGVIAGTQMITVTGTVTATSAAIPKLTLRNGAKVKVSSPDAPLRVTGQFVASGTITLDVEGMELPNSPVPLLSVPSGTALGNVEWQLVNFPAGGTLVRQNGIPCLGKSGFVISIR